MQSLANRAAAHHHLLALDLMYISSQRAACSIVVHMRTHALLPLCTELPRPHPRLDFRERKDGTKVEALYETISVIGKGSGACHIYVL